MKTVQWSKLFLIGYLTLFCIIVRAQSAFKNQAVIKNTTTGFYQIALSPQIIAKCNADLSDIRIIDQLGQTVPYVIQKDLPINNSYTFVGFPVTTVLDAKSLLSIHIYNQSKTSVKNLCLQIKNNDVERSINIKGSDDNTKWYAISEGIVLNGATNSKGYYEQCIPIPLSNYRYFQVTVNGKNKTPLNILKAGTYTDDQSMGKYQPLPKPVINQKDSGLSSYIHLKFDAIYNIDKITLKFAGPQYFSRVISFPYFDSVVFSKKPSVFFKVARTNNLKLVIKNQDNPPLKLISVQAYQLNQTVIAYLETSKKYRLVFGDSTARKPIYDLRFFTDSLSNNLKVAELGEIMPNTDHKTTLAQKPGFNFAYLMWGAIIIIMLALSFFTYKMTIEVKTKDS